MGMKPAKNRSRAIFEEVSAETRQQMPVAPKGGMIDARPKGARRALALWMASLVLLAVLQLGLDATPGLGLAAMNLAQPYSGVALIVVWVLGALGFAAARRVPPGWGARIAGLGGMCLLAAVSDPVPFDTLAKALAVGPVAAPSQTVPQVLPPSGALPPLHLLPAAPPAVAPPVITPPAITPPAAAPAEAAPPSATAQVAAALATSARFVSAQIGLARHWIGTAPFASLRLGLGFALIGFAFWYALMLLRSEAELIAARRQGEARLFRLATGLMHLSFVQLLLGGLVTALGAGAVLADWPLMGGAFLPTDAFSLQPLWRNFLENQGLVQFMHRIAGYLVLIVGVVALIGARKSVHGVTRTAFVLAAIWLVLQVVLGIVALLQGDPVSLRLAHLGSAVLFWLFLLRARFLARTPIVQSIRRTK